MPCSTPRLCGSDAAIPDEQRRKICISGGGLDATLKTVLYALMKARSYMLPPGVPPEDQARDSAAWNTVVFYAALFSHLSALSALRVELEDGEIWTPFDGMPESAYRFRFVPPGLEGADTCLGAMFAARVLPEGVFRWLKLHTPALDMLLLWVGGHRAQCGVINAIVSDAIAEVIGPVAVVPVMPAAGVATAPLVSAVTLPGVTSAPVAAAPIKPPVAAVPVLASALAVPPQPETEATAPADSEVTHSVPETHVSEDEDNTDWEDVAAFLGYEETLPGIRRREGKLYRCRLYDGAGGGFSNLSGYFIDAGKVYVQNPVPADNPLMVVPKRKQTTFHAGEK